MSVLGSSGGIYIGANKVAELQKWALDAGFSEVDVTNFDSNGWKEFLAGVKEWSGSADANLKGSDANGQAALITAWVNGTTVSLEFRVSASVKFAGSAYVKLKVDNPLDKVNISFDFRGTGALTPTVS